MSRPESLASLTVARRHPAHAVTLFIAKQPPNHPHPPIQQHKK